MALRHIDIAIAGIVAFIAWGLLVKWVPFLRYVGYAFVTGAFLTVCVLVVILTTTVRYLEETLRPPVPIPAFLAQSKWSHELAIYASRHIYKPVQLYSGSFVVSQSLESLLNLALRDFVSSWYRNITSSPAFVNEVDRNTRLAVCAILERLQREDVVNVVISRIVPIITNHLREFDIAEKAVRGRALNRNVTESEELDNAIAAKYKDGRLHPAASLAFSDTKSLQQEHLQKTLIRILPELLADGMMASRAVSVLIKEIVSCAVLSPVLQTLCDADTWNQLVEAYGKTALHDRKTVKKMRAALDAHAPLNTRPRLDLELPRLGAHDSERAFERFVRAIQKTRNISEARKFRSQVATQLKRESLVEGQDPVYIRRLQMGKRVLDQKLAKMGSTDSAMQYGTPSATQMQGGTQLTKELSLVEILHTSSGLSYFMEFMDRQHQMSLVQFWIVVDGFRNPLEDDFGDDGASVTSRVWSNTDRTDIAQITESYMSKSELKVPPETQGVIKSFLVAGRNATDEQYRSARRAILSTQSAVLEELETIYVPTFRKSDLYYKFLASDESTYRNGQSRKSVDVVRSSSPAQHVSVKTPTPPMTRKGSQMPGRNRDLRRAALSATDIPSLSSSRLFDDDEPLQRSADSEASTPLFDDGYDTDPLAQSAYSIGHESLNGDAVDHKEVMASMEAALNDIMTAAPHDDLEEEGRDFSSNSPISYEKSIRSMKSAGESTEAKKPTASIIGKSKPSLATLGLVTSAGRIGVFSDNDLFPDEEKFREDEYIDDEDGAHKHDANEEIHEAAPGDLGLTEAITALTNDIEKLVSQEGVVEALTRKAELTNNLAELRILSKSKASLQREIRRKELQRQQYIVQESDNSLYGRSNIQIKSVVVGKEEDGREYALYVIQVQRQAGEQIPAAIWAIARRYSEFYDLHQRLRRRYPSTRNLEFPRRRVVMKLQKQFLHNRRLALENYLQQLLRLPDVCRSRELRSFLSQQAISSSSGSDTASDTQDLVTRIYNSVTEGMDDFLGNMTVMDQLTAAGQSLITAATSQQAATQSDVVIEPGSIAEAEAELQAFEDKELEPFVKPICDIFLETFELNRGNNWLRGRAVVVVLHQLLGGTVERKVRDTFKTMTQEDAVIRYVDLIKETMWPTGKLRVAVVRSAAEKIKAKREATIMLSTLLTDLAAGVVGRANAQAAARKISATMNNARLNQHLVFTIFDEIINVLFPR